jgi:hypothetical protein
MSDASQKDPKVINETFAKPIGQEAEEKSQVVKQLTNLKTDQLSMEIKVASPFYTYYVGQAFSISGVNATGPFDILPKHHNFISLLEPCTLVIRATSGDEHQIAIGGGLIHVKADRVAVFLDI